MSGSLREHFDAVIDLPAEQRAAYYCKLDLRTEAIAELEALVHGERQTLDLPEPPSLAQMVGPDEPLGAYTLVEVIGSGGMGTVYRARRSDGRVQTEVAIKRSEHVLDASRRARLQLERAMLAKLSHPAIGHFIDAGEDVLGRPYLVMELIDGLPLDQWLDSRNADLKTRIGQCITLLEALQHAHSRLVLHRDIKPSNVMVQADGALKLIDFGIARPLDLSVQTQAYGRFLTLANAAPEQVRNEELGTGVDVYGVGVLLYELLSGAHPFLKDGDSAGELERRILAGDLTPPSRALLRSKAEPASRGFATRQAWSQGLRGDLDAIVLTALRTDPSARYASCAAFADDLHAWLQARPVSARAGGAGYVIGRFARRHWLPLSVGTAIIAGLVTFSTLLYQRGMELASERDRAEDQRANAQATSDFMARLFTESNPRSTGTAALTARELLERGLMRLRGETSLSDTQRQLLLQTIAEAFLGLGDVTAAVRSIATADALPNHVSDVVETVLRHRVASAQARAAGDYPTAIRELEAGFKTATENAASFPQINELKLQVIELHWKGGPQEDALRLAQALVAELADQPQSRIYLEAVRLNARILDRLARARESFDLLSTAAQRARSLLKADDPALAEFIQDLAGAHYRLGELEPARQLYKEAEQIFSAAFGSESFKAQGARGGMAVIDMEERRFSKAIAVLRSLVVLQGAQGRNEVMAGTARNLALALERSGELVEALSTIDMAIATGAPIWRNVHSNRLVFEVDRGRIAFQLGELDIAQAAYQAALGMIEQLIANGSIKDAPILRSQAEKGLADVKARRVPGHVRLPE